MTTTPAEDRPRGRRGAIHRAWDAIERAGDRLPDPVVLFVLLAALVLLASFLGARRHAAATHPMTGANIAVTNLLTSEGLRRIAGDAAKSFAALPQLASALMVLFGVGVAERTGLLGAVMRRLAGAVPAWALTGALFFVAAHSAASGDTGIFLLAPLGALLFLGMGRHPLAGLAAAFSGATGGYGAGLILTSMDASLAGITASAGEGSARAIEASSNMYLTWAATLMLTVTGTLVNRLWVEPRLGAYSPAPESRREILAAAPLGGEVAPETPETPETPERAAPSASDEGRALQFAGVVLASTLVVLAALVLPDKGLLRDEAGSPKPFFDALPLVVLVLFLIPSIAFGHFAGTTSSHGAFLRTAGRAAGDLGGFLLLAFVAAQLMAVFSASNLGPVLVIKGARAVRHAHLSGVPLAIGTAGLAAVMGLLVPSASGRWAMMASALVPLFVAAGYGPETAQAAFRSGATSALMVTPLLPHYAVFAACAKRYAPRSGAGTLLSVTLPYSLAFGLGWLVLLGVWLAAGLPLGPGVPSRSGAGSAVAPSMVVAASPETAP